MRKSSTKPQGATSYKETAFGIIPRSKLLKLEIEGTKKGLEYISNILKLLRYLRGFNTLKRCSPKRYGISIKKSY